jgi:hypothetical protein
MPLWLLGLGKGLALGLVGTGVKLFVTKLALKKVKKEEPEKMDKVLLNCYYARHVINIIILVMAYFLFTKDTASLIGTALGLTLPEAILYLKKLY